MTQFIDNPLSGRPQFFKSESESIPNSLFNNNRAILQVLPSAHDPDSFFGKIEKLFWKIIAFFVSLQKPSGVKFEALVVGSSNSSAQMKDLSRLFQRSISSDNKHLESLFQDCDTLIDEIKQLYGATDDDQRIKQKILLREKIKQRIQNLGNGETLLLPATIRREVNIFHVLSRSDKGYCLQTIGCDDWMAELSGVSTKKIGGKEKVHSKIEFKNIPSNYFDDQRITSLFCDPLFEGAFNAVVVKSHFEEMPVRRTDLNERKDLWVTKSSNPRKAFGLVVQEIKQGQGEETSHKTTRKRLEFQTKLIALFDYYKAARFDICLNSENATVLKRLIREIAREASLLASKKYLSKEDLRDIQKELAFIEKTMAKAEVGNELEKTIKSPSLKMAAETLSLATQLKTPVVLPKKGAKPIENVRQADPLGKVTICIEDILPTIISSEDKKALKSNQIPVIFGLFQRKLDQANQYVSEGKKELAVALAMEFVKTFSFNLADDSCWHTISVEELLKAQSYFIEFSKLIMEQRTENAPVVAQFMVLLKLSLLVETLRFSIQEGVEIKGKNSYFGSSRYTPIGDLIHKLFIRKEYMPTQAFVPSSIERCLYQLDMDDYDIFHDLFELQNKKLLNRKIDQAGPVLPESKEKAESNDNKQREYLYQMFGITPDDCLPSEFFPKAFRSESIQRATKGFHNPMFLAALRQMEMRGHLVNVIYKLSAEHKFNGSITFNGNTPQYQTDQWSDAELNEMQKDLDRLESLKLPEAAADNPQAVFDKQMEDFIERMKEEGEEFSPKNLSHQFRKEELTDLLYLLRGKYPQLEGVSFLKTHPHLLSHSDVRNYLEIAMFDPSGSSWFKTLDKNREFMKTLPDLLEEEVLKYQELIHKEPAYIDHLLFIFSVTRKFMDIYQARLDGMYREDDFPIERADEIIEARKKLNRILIEASSKIDKNILQNRDLHKYHYKAIFEYLLFKLSHKVKKEEVADIILLYHKLQTLSRDIYDVDYGEVEKLNRCYVIFINSLWQKDPATLSPLLLDQICSDQVLPLDHSEWKGEFPVYSNNQYNVNILKGEVNDLSGGTIVAIPGEAVENPAYQTTFGEVDSNTLRVRLIKQGNTEIYLVEDKNGFRGRVEKEEGQYRFYKQFPGREKALQVISLHSIDKKTNEDKSLFSEHFPNIKKAMDFLFRGDERSDGHGVVCSLAGKEIFFDPEVPNEGLCLDEKGVVQFKIIFNHLQDTIEIQHVIDCRGKKESQLFHVQTLESIARDDLKKLEMFENGKNILIFSKDNKLKKVEFIRYGLSFTLKKGRLMCDHPKYQGYFIDLNASTSDKSGVPFSLALRHKDEEMPMKLILSDPAVLKNETIQKVKDFSPLEKLWMIGKTMFTNGVNSDEYIEEIGISGPQHTEGKTLKYHVFTVRPYTGELLVAETKEKMGGVLALIRQVLLNKESHLALRPLKQLKLVPGDLTKTDLDNVMKFLLPAAGEGGEAASVKIQLALKLKEVMGERVRFANTSKKLDVLIIKHCGRYLLQGRKMDQRLCLNREQFELMASIVRKTDEEFFDKHLRIFFVDQDKLPKFSTDGIPRWKGYNEIDLDEHVKAAQENGLHGIDKISLETLEKNLKPYVETTPHLTFKAEGTPLIYNKAEIDPYFETLPLLVPDVKLPKIVENAPSCERKAVEKLQKEMGKYKENIQGKNQYSLKASQILPLKGKILEERKTYSKLAEQKKKNVETLLLDERNVEKHLAIKGGLLPIATFHELSIAFLQRDLSSLQAKKLLPSDLDLGQLELALQEYFEAEIKSNLLQNAVKILNKLEDESLADEEKRIQSKILFELLTAKQFYDPTKNPELLVYECFAQKIFRNIGDSAQQIDLLKEIVEQPKGIFQAITGAGKTTLLSVLRGLMVGNGQNLVTFKMLPTLFEQSKGILEEQLGNAFDKHIYTLRFNLKTPLIIRDKKATVSGDTVVEEHSLFKKIYQDLLVTMEQKGCILTDYKSLPLMQEKWIKLSREFVARRAEGMAISNIEKEHWEYLRKILILVKEREESLMDEFDVPNRSCNRLQIPLGKPVELPAFLYEKSLELYEELRNDPRLKLSLDQQRDIPEKTRQEVIQDIAHKIATKIIAQTNLSISELTNLFEYILGKNEKFLETIAQDAQDAQEAETKGRPTLTQAMRDEIAFYKDQFSIFVPLALKKASGLDYKRSSDGKRTIPCHEGEPQENSKFGHPLEEINYTIQDYIQNGISLKEFEEWIRDLQDEVKKNPENNIPLEQYAEIFPGKPFPKNTLSEIELIKQKADLNENWQSVKKFLVAKLAELTVGGEVISMTPHDMASMPKAVSGLSATLGCPEELPQAFNVKDTAAKGIMGEMVYRLIGRTGTDQQPLDYNPETPFNVFKNERFHAVIDGAGAFRSYSPNEVADLFHSEQTAHLKRVGYYNESQKLDFVGKADCTLNQKGFYFSKAKARGADVPLDPEAKALLTVDRQKTLEDLAQNDGRMRLKGQKIRIARSLNNPEIQSTEDLVVMCARNEGASHSVGLFRSKMQEIPHIVRQEAYEQLLSIENFNGTLNRFEEWSELFIQKPSHCYQNAGDYFKQNKHIRKVDHEPLKALQAKKEYWKEKAKTEFGLKVEKLESLDWPKEVLEKCPPLVAGPEDHVSIGLEVEEEVEVENEVENEMDVELEQENEQELQFDQCGDVPYYPAWIAENPKEYSASKWLHKAFDPRINFLENFLPLERKDHLYKRVPFDKAMPKATVIHFGIEKNGVKKFTIGDVLDAVDHRGNYESITYDLRTQRAVDINVSDEKKNSKYSYDSYCSEAAINQYLVGDDFLNIIVQIRFINGQYKGYSESEMYALRRWLENLGSPEEMRQYFEKTILRIHPKEVDAFRKSPLFKLFDDIAAYCL